MSAGRITGDNSRGSLCLCLMLCSFLPATEAKLQAQGIAIFKEMAAASGLSFKHRNGMDGSLWLPEITGSGVALLDFDRDGDLDVFLVQSGALASESEMGATSSLPASDRLFENLLIPTGQLRFEDVTQRSGIVSGEYGMGVAAGDYDNDGWTDLYVTSLRANRLLRNRGNGTFNEVTAAAGVQDRRWSTSATFLDYDRDGQLDLFVTNYVRFDFSSERRCYSPASARDYCGPSAFVPEPDSFWRNKGDGTFEEVGATLGMTEPGAGLGLAVSDYDKNGWLDIYVANDGMPNRLWLNRAGQFSDEALLAGVALNEMGKAEAGMGVDNGDFDRDGDDDLILAHLRGETNTVYVNRGNAFFEDQTSKTALALPSLPMTGFGAGWLDYDNDGWLDALFVNGEVRIIPEQLAAGSSHPLAQPNQLFRNLGNGSFEEVSELASAEFTAPLVSRGAAFGDLDNDGDTDVVVSNNNGPIQLFVNQVGSRMHWLGIEVLEERGSHALGARVELRVPDQPAAWRIIGTDGSYCSANDPRILFGLAGYSGSAEIRVTWVDGTRETWEKVPSGRYSQLRRGSGNEEP